MFFSSSSLTQTLWCIVDDCLATYKVSQNCNSVIVIVSLIPTPRAHCCKIPCLFNWQFNRYIWLDFNLELQKNTAHNIPYWLLEEEPRNLEQGLRCFEWPAAYSMPLTAEHYTLLERQGDFNGLKMLSWFYLFTILKVKRPHARITHSNRFALHWHVRVI